MRYTDRKRPWSDNDSKARRYYARRPGTNDAQKQWICLPPSLVIKGLYIQRKSRCDLNELSTVPKLMATVLSPSTQILTTRRHWLQCARRRSSAKLEPTARSPSATKASSRQTVGPSVPPLYPRCSMAMVAQSRLALQPYQSPKGQQVLDSSPSQRGTSRGHYWGLADPGHYSNQSTTREWSMRGHAQLSARHLAHTHHSYHTYDTLGWDCAPTHSQEGMCLWSPSSMETLSVCRWSIRSMMKKWQTGVCFSGSMP